MNSLKLNKKIEYFLMNEEIRQNIEVFIGDESPLSKKTITSNCNKLIVYPCMIFSLFLNLSTRKLVLYDNPNS